MREQYQQAPQGARPHYVYDNHMSFDRQTKLTIPVALLISGVLASGYVLLNIVSERTAIHKRIDETRTESDKKFTDVITSIEQLSSTVGKLDATISTRTTNRWTTRDMALWCAQMAIVNPGLACVNPYYTINEDADVAGITTWSTSTSRAPALTN